MIPREKATGCKQKQQSMYMNYFKRNVHVQDQKKQNTLSLRSQIKKANINE